MTKLRRVLKIAAIVLLVGAIREEMNKPEAERTGQGAVGGIVPYDFRPPTFERLKQSLWNPDDERLITPHPWGVGWTVNVGRALRVARGLQRGQSSI